MTGVHMSTGDVVRDYLQAHPGEWDDGEVTVGRAFAWRADRLRGEAQAIMDRLGLPVALRAFGDARVVGSVATDLLVELDIDIHVLLPDPDQYRAMNAIYRLFLDRDDVPEVRISDYRSNAGLKLGIDAYPGPSGLWSIDVMVTDRPERTGFALAERIRREMTPAQRLAILAIKGDHYCRGLLEGGVSMRIYEAVLEHGVATIRSYHEHMAGGASC